MIDEEWVAEVESGWKKETIDSSECKGNGKFTILCLLK